MTADGVPHSDRKRAEVVVTFSEAAKRAAEHMSERMLAEIERQDHARRGRPVVDRLLILPVGRLRFRFGFALRVMPRHD